MDKRGHWNKVYRTKAADAVSWYRPQLETSLRLIAAATTPSEPVIDVGGGASSLVDDLLARGHADVTVADLSSDGLEVARRRLGQRAEGVRWLVADILAARLPANHYGLWHDRAVYHFLTEPRDRQRYRAQLTAALRPAGHVVIATFGPQGPRSCSGLPVVRFDVGDICRDFGDDFQLREHCLEHHRTPGGAMQQFLYCHLQRVA